MPTMITSRPPIAGAPVQRRHARHRGLFWLAIVICTFAFAAGGYLAVTTYLRSAEPSDVVTSYFTALQDGDGARALSYGPVPVGDRAYLTDDVLREQLKVGAISDFEVLSVTELDSTATVNINYQLHVADGQQRTVTDTVPMIRKGRHWWLAETAIATRVGLTTATYRATFAGTAIPTHTVVLFPGALPITFDTSLLQIAPDNTTVQFNVADMSSLPVEASPVGVLAARSAVGAALTSCLAATSTNTLCPAPKIEDATHRAVPGSLRGAFPAKALDALAVTVANDPIGTIDVDGTVEIDGKYESLDYNNAASVVANHAIALPITARCYAKQIATVAWVVAPT